MSPHVRFTPRKRTFWASSVMSALCQKRTWNPGKITVQLELC